MRVRAPGTLLLRARPLALAVLAVVGSMPAAAGAQEAEGEWAVPPTVTPVPVDTVAPVAPVPAEAPPVYLSDRILAVVGGTPLLESEWREQLLVLAEQLGAAPGSPEFERIALESYDQMIQDLIIVAAAERDTAIQIDPERLADVVEQEMEAIRSRFPSEEEFLRQLRQSQWGSLSAYREDLVERKRRELLGQAFLDSRRDQIRLEPVPDADVRAYWDENRASIGTLPPTFRFEEIPVTVTPEAAARDSTRAEAERVLAEIGAGADFAMLARQHSDDPESRESGGELGWFGRGRMVPAFEAAVFDAPLGEVIGPVETGFGFHLVQVMDRRSDEVQARHILFAFDRTPADRDRAEVEAEALRDRILAGADVDSLQALYLSGDSVGAAIVELPPTQLPEPYVRILEDLASGEAAVVETGTGFSVIVGRGTAGGGEIAFEEIAPRIRQQIAQQRAEEAFVQSLRESVHVDVRVPPDRLLAG